MYDRTISAALVTSMSLWLAGFGLVVLDLCTRYETGELGLLLACIGAVMNVRCMFKALERREQAAFELGREFEQTLRAVR